MEKKSNSETESERDKAALAFFFLASGDGSVKRLSTKRFLWWEKRRREIEIAKRYSEIERAKQRDTEKQKKTERE